MLTDKNIELPVMEILRTAYLRVIKNIKSILILSYVLAALTYLFSLILPQPSSAANTDQLMIVLAYMATGLFLIVIINIAFYRLFALGRDLMLKLSINQMLVMMGKMALYALFLIFLLFIALLALLLFIGLIKVIVNESTGQELLGDALLSMVVNFTMLIVSLLIIMRLQPTFITIAVGGAILPMKSAYYYTRDNNKELIITGFLSFVPAMMPLLITYGVFDLLEVGFVSSNLLAFLIFPLLLFPAVVLLSAGFDVYNYLVVKKDNPNMDITL